MEVLKNGTQQEHEEEASFSMKDFFMFCLGYWKWFLVSIIVIVGLAALYAFTRQPKYERFEEILVKDQESGVSSVSSQFSQLGLFSSNTKVYNELITFTSPAIMTEVVKRLDLTMNFDLKKA